MWLLSCVDEAYLRPLAVTISSAVSRLHDREGVRYIVVLDRVSPAGVERLRRWGRGLGVDLELVDAQEVGFGELAHLAHGGHVSAASYLRLFAERVLPASADRVLYLDADTVVCADLEALYSV